MLRVLATLQPSPLSCSLGLSARAVPGSCSCRYEQAAFAVHCALCILCTSQQQAHTGSQTPDHPRPPHAFPGRDCPLVSVHWRWNSPQSKCHAVTLTNKHVSTAGNLHSLHRRESCSPHVGHKTGVHTCVGLQRCSLSWPGVIFLPTSLSSSPDALYCRAWCRPTSVTHTVLLRSTVIMWGM